MISPRRSLATLLLVSAAFALAHGSLNPGGAPAGAPPGGAPASLVKPDRAQYAEDDYFADAKKYVPAVNELEAQIANVKVPAGPLIFSGGGIRATVVSLGFCRAYEVIGKNCRTTPISTVSGSSWMVPLLASHTRAKDAVHSLMHSDDFTQKIGSIRANPLGGNMFKHWRDVVVDQIFQIAKKGDNAKHEYPKLDSIQQMTISVEPWDDTSKKVPHFGAPWKSTGNLVIGFNGTGYDERTLKEVQFHAVDPASNKKEEVPLTLKDAVAISSTAYFGAPLSYSRVRIQYNEKGDAVKKWASVRDPGITQNLDFGFCFHHSGDCFMIDASYEQNTEISHFGDFRNLLSTEKVTDWNSVWPKNDQGYFAKQCPGSSAFVMRFAKDDGTFKNLFLLPFDTLESEEDKVSKYKTMEGFALSPDGFNYDRELVRDLFKRSYVRFLRFFKNYSDCRNALGLNGKPKGHAKANAKGK